MATTKKKTKAKSGTSASKKKKGRPRAPDITEADLKKIEGMAAFGMPVKKIAIIMGMSKATFERRCIENPLIFEALERGRANAEMQVTNAAYNMAKSGQNTAMTQFWLKCRAGWKDTTRVEHTGADGAPLSPEAAFSQRLANMSDDELEKFIQDKESQK